MDIEQFNKEWLEAWSAKDTAHLLAFYHPETTYMDPQVPAGLTGHDELRAYLDGLFGMTPLMRYVPNAVWEIDGGFCGRWICTVDLPGGAQRFVRGFDLVLLRDGLISHNEVYTHDLPVAPA